jgi:hypothetical protein
MILISHSQSERAAALIRADHPPSGNPPPVSYQIHPANYSGKCLDVKDGTFADGALVQLWDCNGKAQQQFALTTGSTKIQVAGTNFCLDFGSNPTSGTQVKIWTVSAS